MQNYGFFLNQLYGDATASTDPSKWTVVHSEIEGGDAVILNLNSSMYVEKGKPDQDRGHLDVQQLSRVQEELEKLDGRRLKQAIKIAMIHHHPVLIPPLAEPGRGYDAVHNSGTLLTILRRFGFHMILHGHKHDPYVFTEDSRSAVRQTFQNPILIAAGGSVGSTALPVGRSNCYNRISLKWHPAAGQARILIETVGLSVLDADCNEALPAKWKWSVLRREDTHFLKGECIPSRAEGAVAVPQTVEERKSIDKRPAEYERLRGNMLCVEVRPSLRPKQGYEAVVWLTPHGRQDDANVPAAVEWSAGQKFEFKTAVKRGVDPAFCATFDYWGPMLLQADMTFSDGQKVLGFIYARIPEDCTRS